MTSTKEAKRLARAEQILDAAHDLVLRLGYDKTTVDDIVRASGVPKGTIYLHWRSREDLFGALLRRDRLGMLEQIRDEVRREPGGPTLHGLIRQMALQAGRRPLLRAALLGDSAVLGRLTRRKRRNGVPPELREAIDKFLESLRTAGLVRSDLTAADYTTIVMGTFFGFLVVTPQLSGDLRPSDDRWAELMADVIVRALSPDPTASAEQPPPVATAVLDYLDAVLEVVRAKWQSSLEPPRRDTDGPDGEVDGSGGADGERGQSTRSTESGEGRV